MKSLVALAVIMTSAPGVCAPPSVPATAPCDVPGIRVFDLPRPGGGVILVARKLTHHPVTIRLTATLDRVIADRPLPVIVTLPSAGEYVLAEFRFAIPGSPWHLNWSHYEVSGSLGARHDPKAVYELPWAHGKSYPVNWGLHGCATWYEGGCALDFGLGEGTEVHAARGGVVVGFQDECTKADPKGAPSNYIVILHDDGTLGDYEHLRRGGVVVRMGKRVRAGDLIGYSGNTGTSSGPHLHFGVLSMARDMSRVPQRLRFRVAGSSTPIELTKGERYTR